MDTPNGCDHSVNRYGNQPDNRGCSRYNFVRHRPVSFSSWLVCQTVVDVYRATFQATIEDLAQAKEQYIFSHGKESYRDLIYPYVSRGVLYIWFAPMSLEVEWFINAISFAAAERCGETYSMTRIPYNEYDLHTCSACGLVTPVVNDGGVCQPCFDDRVLGDK